MYAEWITAKCNLFWIICSLYVLVKSDNIMGPAMTLDIVLVVDLQEIICGLSNCTKKTLHWLLLNDFVGHFETYQGPTPWEIYIARISMIYFAHESESACGLQF